MRSNEIHPGDLIAGKYRVRAIMGRTQGLLVEAFHTEFDQRVIIKILPAGWGDEKEIERFRREARTLAKLESEHVARIIDVGSQDDGSFYLVRQYLEGMDLGSYLRQRGQLPLQEAVLLVLQAAEAVAETNGHGIIVRELQPAHMFMTQRAGGAPMVKIIDFGTAKLMRDAAAPTAGGELTATAMFGLSPYSSPELVRKAKNVDQRTDVWSLGAMLYELLTGRPPFSGDTAMLMLQITKEEPVPPTQYRPDLPAEIDQIIGWALAKDVDGRFRNVHALAHALTPFASTEGQILIERIGQITHAAKQRKKAVASMPPPPGSQPGGIGVLPPPTPPPGRPRADDGGGMLKPSGGSTQALPAYNPPPAAPSAFPPPSGGAGAGAGAGAGMQAPPPRSSARPGPASSRSAPLGRPEIATAGPSTVQPSTVRAMPTQPPAKSRRLLYGILAAAAVVVPIIVTVVVLRRPGNTDTLATADTSKPIEVPVATATPTSEPAAAEPTATAAATPPPTPEPTASAAAAATTAPSNGPVAAADPTPQTPRNTSGGGGTRPQQTSQKTPPPSPPPEPDPPKETSSSGGDKGTIVAVATGGSCAFSVNGSSKGTSSSIKVSVAPGTYSVTCKPSGGSAKTKSVTVKSGATAFAAFKL